MAYLPVVLPENPADGAIQAIFIATYSLILVRVMLLDASKFSDTRNKLVLVLLYRLIPVGSLLGDFGEVEMIDIISNGLFTSLSPPTSCPRDLPTGSSTRGLSCWRCAAS